RKIEKTSLGAFEYVPWTYCERTKDAVEGLRRQGIPVAAVEVTEQAIPLQQFQWPKPVAVVFGNEVSGINPRVIRRCDAVVAIPMHGYKNSINVATALGIILYDVLRAWKAFGD
ncbi:MAG TPA: TrmH family RNA methyltransferase, partial [Candidatus Hydrogenedentes bacterium]|nr:TrmH family RNA methyltransferase [Candidatus Hydrogenedentota bacterium]